MGFESSQKETPDPICCKQQRKGTRGERAKYAATVVPRQINFIPGQHGSCL